MRYGRSAPDFDPGKVFDSMDAVEDALVEALATLENENKRVLGLTGFDWIVCIPMNAP